MQSHENQGSDIKGNFRLKEHGSDVRLTIYPEAGHDSWTETYENPSLYEWLLAQKRRPRESERQLDQPPR